MALEIQCFMCDTELDEPGALLFSPPTPRGRTTKRHLCVGCWKILDWYFKRVKEEALGRLREEARTTVDAHGAQA